MRFCQVDDTGHTLPARFHERNPLVVALTAQTILERTPRHETPRGVELSISQEEVARFLGLSRQVVNQYLQNWKGQGWLTLGRGKIVIVDERALRDVLAAHSSV
jgi:CRP-like cAMP-binding protein